ncbi:MAG: PEP-CTERM sorting domain-containing protein [Phycisphaeraceae bacterium]
MKSHRYALAAVLACGLSGYASAATVFSENFDARTSGNVTAASNLGTGWAFTGGAFGNITAGADKAYTSAIAGFPGSNDLNIAANSTGSADPAIDATTLLTASFDAVQVDSANATTLSMDIGGYGSNNSRTFKAMTVRGLSSTGDEVFEAWIGFGSGNNTRFIYAREAGDTNYTLGANDNASNPAGTAVVTNIAGDWNGTNTGTKPGGLDTLTMSIQNNQVTYGFASGGAVQGTLGGTLTFGINSAASDLAQLEFVGFDNLGSQNRGYWLDNISVNGTLVPEPSSLAMLGLGGLALLRRRRA